MSIQSQKKLVQVKSKRLMVRQEDVGSPDFEPLFVNHMEASHSGADVFLDFGIIRPEDVMALDPNATDGVQEIAFHILQRVVMSVNTFAQLQRKVGELFGKIKERGDDILDETLKPAEVGKGATA